MVDGIAHQPLQQGAGYGPRLAFHHGGVQVVQRLAQNDVLIVDALDSHGKLIGPDYKCHLISPAGACRRWGETGARAMGRACLRDLFTPIPLV
jgi:hypothetical protein